MIIIITLNVLIVQSVSKEGMGQKDVRWVVAQGMMFSAAFLITWTPSTISTLMISIGRGGFVYDMMCTIFEPLQGFWNMLILLRSNPTSMKRLQSFFRCQNKSKLSSSKSNDGQISEPSGVFAAAVSDMFEIQSVDDNWNE
jgi:hypothetical protein